MKEFELEPGEHEVMLLRKHWFLFLIELLPYAILAVIPFALPNLLGMAPPLAQYRGMLLAADPALAHAAIGVWLLVVWTGAWSAFTRYYLNAWVLTNTRIVDIKQHGYFNREVSSLLLTRVQDVTTEVKGITASLLDLGTINVQSAGAVDEFQMSGIPHPEQMRDLILKYVSTEPAKGIGV